MHFTKTSDIKLLKNIDITESQFKIYTSVLHLGIATVISISKETGINRQQIYNDTEKLVEIGLLELTSKNKKRFIAAYPNKLTSIYEEKIRNLNSIAENIHELVESAKQIKKRKRFYNNITVFEGKNKIQQAFDQELELSKGSLVLSIVGDLKAHFNEIDEKYWHRWNQKFANNKSSSRMIIESHHPYLQSDKEHNRETKILENLKIEANIDVWNNFVLIISPKENIGILIESEIIANSYKMIFNTLWAISKNL